MIELMTVIILVLLYFSVQVVPEQEVRITESFGKYARTLKAGIHFIIPVVEKVAYKHSLKEQALEITPQPAISQDNVTLKIDGVLYVKIIDPEKASYGVEDPFYALSQLAQTTMRSEIGKMQLDKTFEEREALNHAIVSVINEAAKPWGIVCFRYEIKDIHPPEKVINAMEMQVEAERRKRAQILDSEGLAQATVNKAEADRQQQVLASEAAKIDQVNRAKGEAEALKEVADAKAYKIKVISEAINEEGGKDAVSLKVAEQYVEAFSHLAKENNTVLLPADMSNPGSMVANAMAIFKSIAKEQQTDK
tara:strand:- start:108 stop:1028 length:921 start_codon:yes stop_codon:yes gene_type:complete